MTKNATTPGDFLTVRETAQFLRLCEKQIRRLISRGELPAYRFGIALRIKRQDIEAYAGANGIGGGFRQQYRRISP
jgi:excisionase family DNA binding protein